jgi:DNA-binding NarL/FixJ family response regulator
VIEVDPRPRRAGVDVETQRGICLAYQRKRQTIYTVAAEFYVSPSTVHKILVDNGVPRKRQGHDTDRLTTDDLLEVGELYARGLNLREIGIVLDVHPTTVKWRLLKAGVPLRTRHEAQLLVHRRRRERVSRGD